MNHHMRTASGSGLVLEVTPRSAGWETLGFSLLRATPGMQHVVHTNNNEIAFVPISGSVRVTVDGVSYTLARSSVFTTLPHVLYVPPGREVVLEADGNAELAWGYAPAEGHLPTRLFTPQEMRREVRGGGPAVREVHHVLSHPMPAERLIVFEVYVPGGAWSGWPPHCHDGRIGSKYLEEVYYYRMERPEAFALHRNYTRETDLDEVLVVRDGDLVAVPGGFHPVAAAPGSNTYFLNFLSGDLLMDERGFPPVDDPDHAWITSAWDEAPWSLPLPFDDAPSSD